MKIIVPMAGMGKRMRPHTLTTPKPLFSIAGKPIVQRLVEDIAGVVEEEIEEIAFIIGRFGKEVEEQLVKVAASLGAKGSIYFQDEALGTAHAIMCAKESISGPVIVAFADTLFKADFTLDATKDGIIWVHQIDDPRQFGVVQLDENNVINDFVEKPQEFVSDLAIIGIYYFKDGDNLKVELQYLLDNKIMDKGEYQITDALQNMTKKGKQFVPGEVVKWLDCGNKNATVDTNQKYLEVMKNRGDEMIAPDLKLNNAQIIEPCFIGENVVIENSIIGPHASIDSNTKIINSVINNTIVHTNAEIDTVISSGSIIGNFTKVKGTAQNLSVSDYSTME
jgi:glucose-1-phosphate thymidylyltransferase